MSKLKNSKRKKKLKVTKAYSDEKWRETKMKEHRSDRNEGKLTDKTQHKKITKFIKKHHIK